jgi:hypothetical protein
MAGRPEEFWEADEVVGGHGEGELPVDLGAATVAGLAQSGHRLGPAECLLNALPNALANRIAGMAGGATVNGRAARVAGVLRQVLANVDPAQLSDEVMGVKAFVAARGDLLGAIGMA